MNRARCKSLRTFFLKHPTPLVLQELIDKTGKGLNEMLPTVDELYRALQYVDEDDFPTFASTCARLFLQRIFETAHMKTAEASQLASQAVEEGRPQIESLGRTLKRERGL